MGTKIEDIAYVSQLIYTIGETHFTHPDPVARLFAAGMAVDQALMCLMQDMLLRHPREPETICAGG
jgi:hypothetical protein